MGDYFTFFKKVDILFKDKLIFRLHAIGFHYKNDCVDITYCHLYAPPRDHLVFQSDYINEHFIIIFY